MTTSIINNVKLEVIGQVDENPNMKGFNGDNWKVKLMFNDRQYTLLFSKGYGQQPTAREVLECLQSDYFYTDLGLSKAQMKALERQNYRIHKMFGPYIDSFLEYDFNE